jgi:hypothetical protein
MTRNLTPILLGAKAPRVLTVPMCMAALADSRGLPDKKTVTRWIHAQRIAGTLRPVTRGLYLNNLARPQPQAAEAAAYVRTGAVVSLQTVLGDAGVSNNYSDIITSVLPIRGRSTSSSRTAYAQGLEFRFHVMPERLLDERAGSLEDRFDLDVSYARATPEKALMDWIYLGASVRTKISSPPLDMDFSKLKVPRLKRLAKSMNLQALLEEYLARKARYDHDPEVQANAAA